MLVLACVVARVLYRTGRIGISSTGTCTPYRIIGLCTSRTRRYRFRRGRCAARRPAQKSLLALIYARRRRRICRTPCR